MPVFLQNVMQFVPSTHFVSFSQAVLFRNATPAMVWPDLAKMFAIGSVYNPLHAVQVQKNAGGGAMKALIMQTNPSPARATKRWLLIALPVALAAGCTVGPQYSKPVIIIRRPSARRRPLSIRPRSPICPWWSVFNDPALQLLVTQALANNYDIQIAVARIEKARAHAGRGSGRKANLRSVTKPISRARRTFSPQRLVVKFADLWRLHRTHQCAWELDVWGRIRRSTEAARANLLAQEDVRRAVILTLVGDLAAAYFRLIELDRELDDRRRKRARLQEHA
jgi:multidrug efflux system outer membrane protein